MTRILTLLRTPGAMLAALVLALVAQLEHTAQVFMLVVGATGIPAQLHAYAFALAVETAVLLFVLAGHQRISYAFALATFATNLSYYAMAGVNLFSVQGLPAWLMSLLLPAAIVGYSHTIAESHQEPPQATQTPNNTAAPAQPHSAPPVQPQATLDNIDAMLEPATPAVKPPAQPRKPARRKTAKPTQEQRRAQIASSGVTDPSAIMAQFGVKLRTAQEDIKAVRSALTAQNGATH